MNLKISDIKKDITGFKARISEARGKLAELPAGHLPYPEYKKREKIRREYKADIKHYKTLIDYAAEGIEIRQQEEE